MSQISIIIPVYNNWDLTRNCLKSIAANTDGGRSEVIIVDNASSDTTAKGCGFLGHALFDDSFHYIRNDHNRNFSGACNQGAEKAQGNFLIFLNNDTTVTHGWADPLIKDFSEYPEIAATGPLLLYPYETPIGPLIQHLGIVISPFYKLAHLYSHLPAASPLARKRRFFQAITGACLATPRRLFLEAGKFDENFVNGYEDVDLCARYTAMGKKMTVNPKSTVIHYEGKSAGRYEKELQNAEYLLKKSAKFLKPDWHTHLEADGFLLKASPWARLCPELPNDRLAQLNASARLCQKGEIVQTLLEKPYWSKGWLKLMEDSSRDREYLAQIYFRLFPAPETLAELASFAATIPCSRILKECETRLDSYASNPHDYKLHAEIAFKWCKKHQLKRLAGQYRKNLKRFPDFLQRDYPWLLKEIDKIKKQLASCEP